MDDHIRRNRCSKLSKIQAEINKQSQNYFRLVFCGDGIQLTGDAISWKTLWISIKFQERAFQDDLGH